MRIYDTQVMARHYSQQDLMILARTAVKISRELDSCLSNLDRTNGTIAEWMLGLWRDVNELGQSALDAVAIQCKQGR